MISDVVRKCVLAENMKNGSRQTHLLILNFCRNETKPHSGASNICSTLLFIVFEQHGVKNPMDTIMTIQMIRENLRWFSCLALFLISPGCDIAKKIDPSAFNQTSGSNSNSNTDHNNSPSSNPTSTPTSTPTTPVSGGGGAPSAPTGLKAMAASSTEINLSWTSTSSNQTGFIIQRAPLTAGPFVSGAGSFVTIQTVTGNITSYSDTTVSPSTSYYYQVEATDASGSSAPCASVEATTLAPPVSPPAAPSNLVATAAAATIINLSWVNNASNAASFKVYRSSNGGSTFTLIAITASNNPTFEDVNLLAGTPYVYRVTSSNTAGDSIPTANTSVTTLAAGNSSTFTYVNTNIIATNCLSCHTNGNAAGGVNYSTPSGILGSVSANNTGGSRLYTDMQSGKMPPGGGITALQLSQIAAWINSGAPTNN